LAVVARVIPVIWDSFRRRLEGLVLVFPHSAFFQIKNYALGVDKLNGSVKQGNRIKNILYAQTNAT
jgi:hypothetical protein